MDGYKGIGYRTIGDRTTGDRLQGYNEIEREGNKAIEI